MGASVLLIVTILIALGFDFTNGFHDTANAVATSISTRALGPRAAVALSTCTTATRWRRACARSRGG